MLMEVLVTIKGTILSHQHLQKNFTTKCISYIPPQMYIKVPFGMILIFLITCCLENATSDKQEDSRQKFNKKKKCFAAPLFKCTR